jgi:hypothetical protein
VETGNSFAPAETTCAACRGEGPVAGPVPVMPTLGVPPIPASLPPSPQMPEAAPFAAPFALPPAPPEKKGPRRVWVVLTTLIAGVLAGAGSLLQSSDALKQGAGEAGAVTGMAIGTAIIIIGFSFVAATLCAGILAIFKQPFRRVLRNSYCVAVLAIAGLYFVGSGFITLGKGVSQRNSAEAQNTKETLEGLESDMQAMVENMQSEGKDGPLRLGEGEVPKDDLGKVRHMTQSIFNDAAAAQAEYGKALEQGGLFTILDPARLAEDEDLSESRELLASCREVVASFRQKTRAIVDSSAERLQKYPMDPDTRRKILKGMTDAKARSTDYHGMIWDLEEKILDHMGEVIDHLEAKRAEWVIENDLITFSSDEGLETYDAIMAKIEACGAKQEEVRKSAAQNFQTEINSMKSSLPK